MSRWISGFKKKYCSINDESLESFSASSGSFETNKKCNNNKQLNFRKTPYVGTDTDKTDKTPHLSVLSVCQCSVLEKKEAIIGVLSVLSVSVPTYGVLEKNDMVETTLTTLSAIEWEALDEKLNALLIFFTNHDLAYYVRAYKERAAIREFDGNLSRVDADGEALKDVVSQFIQDAEFSPMKAHF